MFLSRENIEAIHYGSLKATNGYPLAGPQREIFPGGTKIDAGPPKLGEEQKKRKVLTQIWSHFLPKIRWRPEKKVVFIQTGCGLNTPLGATPKLDDLNSSGPP